jgi:SAM-dependent methyltransferase
LKVPIKSNAVDSPEFADQSLALRMSKVLSMIPADTSAVLEIGARHGVMTRALAEKYDDITALDLTCPKFNIERVRTVAGNVERLEFPDDAFDCVICTEVLEHVPDVVSAARELIRVTRRYVLVGVPYLQDRRVGRTTCNQCGKINPPWGHLHTFDHHRLAELFAGARTVSTELVSENRERTNWCSVWLQDYAGNPYGNYYQEERCIYCGCKMQPPDKISLVQRIACAAGARLYELQVKFNRPQPTWVHLLLSKV